MNDLQKPQMVFLGHVWDNGTAKILKRSSEDYEKPKNFDIIETTLEEELLAIRTLLDRIHEVYGVQLRDYMKRESSKKEPLYWYFDFQEWFVWHDDGRYEGTPIGNISAKLVEHLVGGNENG